MLEHEATLELINKAQQGDDDAKEKLITENIPLIKSIVKRFKGRLEYDDLMQLGAMGFIKAIQNFNADFGVRFSTYAVPMISGEIKRFLRDDGSIKVSRSLKTLSARISMYIEQSGKDGNGEPTIEELASHFEVEAQEIVFALDAQHYIVSLSSTSQEDDTELADRIADEQTLEGSLDKMMLKEFIEKLPLREKKIIVLRYFRDKTQSEIAKELGVSQVQVSRIEAKVLKSLKEKLADCD